MKHRTFGRTGRSVSEVGYGMWGMGGWTGSNDDESMASLERAVDLGCNFFDTAWAYGQGHSERLLGQLLRARPASRLYCATKIPPKNMKWPAGADASLDETYPPDHIREFAEKRGGRTRPLEIAHGHPRPSSLTKPSGLPVAVNSRAAMMRTLARGGSNGRL